MRCTPEWRGAAGGLPRRIGLVAAWVATQAVAAAIACPFCGPVGRPLAERRDAADRVAVAEADGAAGRNAAGLVVQSFRIRQPIRGAVDVNGMATARVDGPVRGTAILFGSSGADDTGTAWEGIAADEPLLAHVAAAPTLSRPPAERLAWYAARLEHPDRGIAEDAFAEFARAPFAQVLEIAEAFRVDDLVAWVADPGIDQRRRGFYGLVLGIVATRSTRPEERARCVAALGRAIGEPGHDLRGGFDGLLGGLLVAEGVRGLEQFDTLGLLAADTRAGDARHALAALRFARESLGDRIPAEAVAAATARLLANPAVAADAAVDLARYRHWGVCEQVAGLWQAIGRDDPLVRRAVAGYLAACPLPAARHWLDRLRAADPAAVEEALRAADLR